MKPLILYSKSYLISLRININKLPNKIIKCRTSVICNVYAVQKIRACLPRPTTIKTPTLNRESPITNSL